MPNDIDEMKKEAEEIQNKITFLATQQVELSKSVEALRPVVKELGDKKEFLLSELDVITKRIAEKEAQRNENLNIRGKELEEKAAIQASESNRLNDLLKTINQKEIRIREECASIAEYLKNNLNIAKILDARESTLNDLSQGLSEKVSQLNAREDVNKGIVSELLQETIRLEKLESDLQVKKQKLDEESNSLTSYAESIQERENALHQSLIKLAADQKSLSEKSQEVDSRLALVNQKDKEHAGQLEIIEQEKKRLELGWLQINKKNQDKQLGMDLEALKK